MEAVALGSGREGERDWPVRCPSWGPGHVGTGLGQWLLSWRSEAWGKRVRQAWPRSSQSLLPNLLVLRPCTCTGVSASGREGVQLASPTAPA